MKYWQIAFYIFISGVVLESIIFLSVFFLGIINPTVVVPIKARDVALILIGGVSKEFLLGFYTLYSYQKWHEGKGK